MRSGRVGACIGIAGVFVALRLIIAIVGIAQVGAHPAYVGMMIALISIAALMLVQIAFVASFTRLQMRISRSALLMVPGLAIIVMIGFLPRLGLLPHSIPALVALRVLRDLSLMLLAVSFGYTLSFLVKAPNVLLPAGVCAALVDFWGVNWGPLSRMLVSHPDVVAAASVQMPTPIRGMPGTMIGMGDFVFLALFFAVMYRHSMNVKGAFWLGYGLLTLSMFAVMTNVIGAIPALVPMVIAIVGMNMKFFKLKRDEWFAVLYAGLLIVALFAIWMFAFRR
jgi:hypothetical protein